MFAKPEMFSTVFGHYGPKNKVDYIVEEMALLVWRYYSNNDIIISYSTQ